MPTYVYACDACGTQFEQFQRFQDEPLKSCPCGKEGQVRRVFQPVGIVFKGTGWYINDSRKAAASTDGEQTTSTTSDTTKKDASPAPAEAKPAEARPAETKSAEASKSAA